MTGFKAWRARSGWGFFMNLCPVCPHCGQDYEVEGDYPKEEGEHTLACEHCGKDFTFELNITYQYTTKGPDND